MVTRQRSDVIASNSCLAWWGYFGGDWSVLTLRRKIEGIVYLDFFFSSFPACSDNKTRGLALHQSLPEGANFIITISLQFPSSFTFLNCFLPALLLILQMATVMKPDHLSPSNGRAAVWFVFPLSTHRLIIFSNQFTIWWTMKEKSRNGWRYFKSQTMQTTFNTEWHKTQRGCKTKSMTFLLNRWLKLLTDIH